MANNIQVKVTADVVQLQTQFAVARAETNALTSEVNKLARATAAGTIDPAGTARLKDLAAQLISSRSAMQGYAAQAAEAGVSLTSFGSAAAGAGHHSATAVRYVRELFDEISSGRTRYLPSTLASLGQTVLGMNLAMLAGVGAVGGLVAALAILAYRSVEAAAALDKAKIAADFSGNLSLSETAIRQFTAQLSSAANISKSEAQSITDALVRVPDMSTHTFSALASLVAAYAEASGEDVKKIGESLSKMFAPSESAEKLAASMAGITQREKDMAEAADRTGNVYQIQAAKLEILSDATNRAAADRAKLNSTLHTGSILQDIKNLGEYAKDVIIDNDADEARTVLLARNTAEVNRNADAVRSQIAALRQMPPPSQSVLQLGVEAATKENPLSLQILNTQTEIKKMTAALVVAKQQGDQINVRLLEDSIGEATVKLDELVKRGSLDFDSFRRQIQRLNDDLSKVANEGLNEASRQMNETLVQQAKETYREHDEIVRQDADSQIAISRMTIEARKRGLEADVESSRISAAQKLKILRDLTDQEYQLDLQQLQNQAAKLNDQPVEYDRVMNKIRELKARNVLDLAQLDKEYTDENAREVKKQAQSWRSAVAEIGSTAGSLTLDLLSKRKTLSQGLLQISSDLVTREIQNDVRAMTTRILLNRTEEASKKALEEGGFIYHLLFANKTLASDVATQAARTSAATAGAAARTAATSSAAAAAQGIESSTGPALVMADAAKAAAGTFASIAQIPYVGPFLAPEMAAASFAQVAAYAPLASLDVGAWQVPHDMVAQIHEGETVVPKDFASGLRENGGLDGSGNGGGDTHYHSHNYSINAVDAQSFLSLARRNGSGLAALARGLAGR